MGSAQRPRSTRAASVSGGRYGELAADISRSREYVRHAYDLAQRGDPGPRLVAELLAIADQLSGLHQVALVLGGRCPDCGGGLTDPALSPSNARHCRRCRVGWALEEGDRVRVRPRRWPLRVPVAEAASRRSRALAPATTTAREPTGSVLTP